MASTLPWLALLSVISYVFWILLPPGAIPFWLMWIMFCWPILIPALIFLVRGGRPPRSGAPGLPGEYLRAEYRPRPHPRA
jgi:hypothetical protein